ncbi:MAG TPA: flagellar export chaperone FliS [Phycisphaerae bacterium]|nr:flagellar export chaperone FliS [Phycisphaerae bacterium]
MALPNQEYLKTKVMTASPEMLTLMLWDGAIRFAEQGKDAILKKDIEGSYKALTRAQRIITELNTGLRHEVDPDLCGKLAALYNFIFRRLVDANISKNPTCVDDALDIMRHQRETWVLLMDKLAKEKAAGAQEMVSANADAVASADDAHSAVAAAPLPANRRGYPAFAVRPAMSAATATLSVEG